MWTFDPTDASTCHSAALLSYKPVRLPKAERRNEESSPSFLELFARLQTRDINDMSPNPFTWRWKFFLLAEKKKKKKKKKEQDIFCSRMWAWIFRVKRSTVGMHNAMAQISLETNLSGQMLQFSIFRFRKYRFPSFFFIWFRQNGLRNVCTIPVAKQEVRGGFCRAEHSSVWMQKALSEKHIEEALERFFLRNF